MFRVSGEDLKMGLEMAEIAYGCPQSKQCLWGTFEQCLRERKEEGGVFEQCLRVLREHKEEDCPLIEFRRKFEDNSPLFFKVYIDLSRYNTIISNWNQADIEGTDEQKNLAVKEKGGLRYFAWKSLRTLAPLYFANNRQIPLVLLEDLEEFFPDLKAGIKDTKYIEKALEKFLIEEAELEEEFKCMGEGWFHVVIRDIKDMVYGEYPRYAKSLCLLLKSFRKGLVREKRLIGGFKSQEERDEFIKELETFLGFRQENK